MRDALRVGLVGCGRIAQLVHLNLLTDLPDVRLVAVADADPGRREEAARRAPGAIALADYLDLLAMPDVEAVVICLPNALHAEAGVAALKQGKHVYLEKPLATGIEEGRRLLEAWRGSGRVGMVGFNYRFNPLYQSLGRLLRSGRLGELVAVRSVFSTSGSNLPLWGKTREAGGGVLVDLASHHVDLIHHLLGRDVASVSAQLRSQRTEDDTAVMQLRLDDGLPVQSLFSTSTVEEDRIEIYGQSGKLSVDRYLSLDVELTDPHRRHARLKQLWRGLSFLWRSPYHLSKLRSPGHEPSYRAAMARFVAAARGAEQASPDFWDGYRSLRVIEAAYESARTGRAVSLSEPVGEELPVNWRMP